MSLGDVAVMSSASIEIHVKSGGLDRVDLALPAGANLLNLVAPSLRTHRVVDGVVEVEFTQEMEGDFRIEATYERLLGENAAEVEAGTLRVRGAEVEQGRIAVEASSAVEVARRSSSRSSRPSTSASFRASSFCGRRTRFSTRSVTFAPSPRRGSLSA